MYEPLKNSTDPNVHYLYQTVERNFNDLCVDVMNTYNSFTEEERHKYQKQTLQATAKAV